MPLHSVLILSVSVHCFDDKGTRPNETYPETGDDFVVFGGGCGVCNVRPSQDPSITIGTIAAAVAQTRGASARDRCRS